jgi:hypothetical protein
MFAIVTSRIEEMNNNSVIMNATFNRFDQLCDRLEKLIYPMKVERTSRVGVYEEAEQTLRGFIGQHQSVSDNIGLLLVIQRTPSPIFHSNQKKDKLGYIEEGKFNTAIFEAIDLAKKKKIKMIFAFPFNDPKILTAAENLYRIDKEIVDRINKFGSSFVNKADPHAHWANLRLYPLNNRTVQPLMVADKLIEIYVEEAEGEIVFIRAVDDEKAKDYFERYWKLTENVAPLSALNDLESITEKLSTQHL